MLARREIKKLGSTRLIEVDVRVVAATNRDLSAMVRQAQFREDLNKSMKTGAVQASLKPNGQKKDLAGRACTGNRFDSGVKLDLHAVDLACAGAGVARQNR